MYSHLDSWEYILFYLLKVKCSNVDEAELCIKGHLH
jgi:hypothetical protein